ncbi:MAG TPA: hypothetical protein VNN62_27870 [Methylomirabilota bacterium]|nr:hypothetical protein [Methylomirabilota bacterium]
MQRPKGPGIAKGRGHLSRPQGKWIGKFDFGDVRRLQQLYQQLL